MLCDPHYQTEEEEKKGGIPTKLFNKDSLSKSNSTLIIDDEIIFKNENKNIKENNEIDYPSPLKKIKLEEQTNQNEDTNLHKITDNQNNVNNSIEIKKEDNEINNNIQNTKKYYRELWVFEIDVHPISIDTKKFRKITGWNL